MKLLNCLEEANRNNLAAHAAQLTLLQKAAADIDGEEQSPSSMRFLDLQTAYRISLEPQTRRVLEILAAEDARAGILRRQLGDAATAIKALKFDIQSAADAEILGDLLSRKSAAILPASHKPTEQ